MFNFIHRLFHAKEKAVDTPHINDCRNVLLNNLIRFNDTSLGGFKQARKWGK
ncbi:hypothetical protein [Apilactobacillus timberlakei]|uniref:hypothetical protein n=1 Tax=Apilactobacillus timberlakei TaxID=2008380 RepID=UPI0015E84363|nr:hypothetical protein [Apilactobacillus timberlakei]